MWFDSATSAIHGPWSERCNAAHCITLRNDVSLMYQKKKDEPMNQEKMDRGILEEVHRDLLSPVA